MSNFILAFLRLLSYRFSILAIFNTTLVCAAVSFVFGSWLRQVHYQRSQERSLIQRIEMIDGRITTSDNCPRILRPFLPDHFRDSFKRVGEVVLPLRNECEPNYSRKVAIILRQFDHLEQLYILGCFYDDIYADSSCLDSELIMNEVPDIQIGARLH